MDCFRYSTFFLYFFEYFQAYLLITIYIILCFFILHGEWSVHTTRLPAKSFDIQFIDQFVIAKTRCFFIRKTKCSSVCLLLLNYIYSICCAVCVLGGIICHVMCPIPYEFN